MKTIKRMPVRWEEKVTSCICDRCGKDITTKEYNFQSNEKNLKGISLPMPDITEDCGHKSAPDDYEVCLDCYSEVYEFYRTKKTA